MILGGDCEYGMLNVFIFIDFRLVKCFIKIWWVILIINMIIIIMISVLKNAGFHYLNIYRCTTYVFISNTNPNEFCHCLREKREKLKPKINFIFYGCFRFRLVDYHYFYGSFVAITSVCVNVVCNNGVVGAYYICVGVRWSRCKCWLRGLLWRNMTSFSIFLLCCCFCYEIEINTNLSRSTNFRDKKYA